MNLFELQQRANMLVNKVNEYEASLTGTEIDETDTLNQHKYADLYSLRPVMKLLFGTTIDEKLNRTLDNDIPLKVFASSAPANNSTFNLLSFNPGLVQSNFIDYDTNNYSSNHPKVSMNNTKKNSVKYHLDLWLPRINDNNETDAISLKINNTTITLGIYNLKGLYLTCKRMLNNKYLWNTYDFKLLNMNNRETYYGGRVSFDLDFKYLNTYDYPIVTISNRVSSNYSTPEGINAGQQINLYYTVEALYLNKSIVQDISSCYSEAKTSSMDVGYKSDTHEFMNNIDMYNNYNMLQLDVKQNSVTDRDTRIKQGINYSYSSNIADALVTESQIANIFKWNTTTDTQTYNNTLSVNRQVPGIVCYYLGNNYRGTYTATIPYATLTDNINSVNYSTPAYYGAYYSTDVTTSQVGVAPGADACRIFMPGLNYTRGMLISPQQIWQPEKLVGDDNTNKGFNWQGQAIYHELVFKNRRPGSKDNNVDFIPTIDTVADNDPQGLATRFALAQQKPYYNNRPWFNELDELYGKDATKLVNYINANSISKPPTEYKTVINDTILTQVGEPTLSDSGVASNFSDSNFYTIDKSYITDNCEIVLCFQCPESNPPTNTQIKLLDTASNSFGNIYKASGGHASFYNNKTGSSLDLSQAIVTGKFIRYLKLVVRDTTTVIISYSTDGLNYTNLGSLTDIILPTASVYLGRSQHTGEYWTSTIDLSKSYIKRSTDTEPISFTKVIQTQGEKFNKDLFTLEDNLSLSNDGILSNLDGTHKVSLSELSYSLTEDIQNVCIYFPELTLTNTSSSMSNSPMNCTFNFNKSDGSTLCGFGIVANKSEANSISIAGTLYNKGESHWPSFTAINNNNSNKAYIRLKYASPVTIDNDTIQYAYAVFQYYDYSAKTWSNISDSFRISNAYLRLTNLRNSKFGLYNTTNLGQKLDSIDLSKFKITANNDQITIFSPMQTPGETTMTDEEFYKNYKLDYDTWANALNKPL